MTTIGAPNSSLTDVKPPTLDTSVRGVRKFGLVLGIFFALLTAFWSWKGHRPYLTVSASIFFLTGAAFPPLLRPVQKVWMAFAFFMGRVMTTVILTAVYIFFLTPLALVSRACGVDFLRPKRRDESTFWIPSEITQSDKTRYMQQF